MESCATISLNVTEIHTHSMHVHTVYMCAHCTFLSNFYRIIEEEFILHTYIFRKWFDYKVFLFRWTFKCIHCFQQFFINCECSARGRTHMQRLGKSLLNRITQTLLWHFNELFISVLLFEMMRINLKWNIFQI